MTCPTRKKGDDTKNKIKQYRQLQNLTQEALAQKSKLTTRHLQKIEAGSDPKVSTALKISQALNKTVEDLYSA